MLFEMMLIHLLQQRARARLVTEAVTKAVTKPGDCDQDGI